MSRHKLILEPEDDLIVIGIACHERDYRLCWRLNKAFELGLECCGSDILNQEVVSAYSSYKEDDQISYNLIANRNEDGWLVPEHKQVDYFLTMDDPHQKPVVEMLNDIRGLNNVLAAYEMSLGDSMDKLRLS